MRRPRVNSKALRTIREERGLSLNMAAALIGISHQTLGYLERGVVRRPHRLTIEQIAKTYEVPVEEIAS
jgi:transcriptional regulator with XRE-family HTH domain